MTRLPRPTLRALRSVVARALGVRRFRVRVVEDVYPYDPSLASREVWVRLVATGRESGRDRWSYVHSATARGCRNARRYIARRARAGDLP